jgi:hypothetical protein
MFDDAINKLDLNVQVHSSPEELVFQFILLNCLNNPVYLFDKTYRAKANQYAVQDSYLMYHPAAPNKAIIRCGLHPIPPGMTFVTPPTALASRVDPSQKFEGVGRIKVPLRETGVGPRTDENGKLLFEHLETIEISTVQFELGYVESCEKLQAVKILDDPETYRLAAYAWSAQKWMRSQELKLKTTAWKLRVGLR